MNKNVKNKKDYQVLGLMKKIQMDNTKVQKITYVTMFRDK